MPFGNSNYVKDGTAQPVADFFRNNLVLRVCSATVLVPPVLLAVYFGFPYFDILIGASAVALAWEWKRLTGEGRVGVEGSFFIIVILGSVFAGSLGMYSMAVQSLALAGFIFAVTMIMTQDKEKGGNPIWMVVGVFYIGLPSLALMWLRSGPGDKGDEFGLHLIMWLFAVVWSADIGAYAAGRSIGGPKLAPRISPNKTWAGLMGGVLAASIAGYISAIILDSSGMVALVVLSAVTGLVSQGGDLLESWIKRRFDVKDSSNLIPGHGGLLDRVDALLAAAFVIAMTGLLSKSTLTLWQ